MAKTLAYMWDERAFEPGLDRFPETERARSFEVFEGAPGQSGADIGAVTADAGLSADYFEQLDGEGTQEAAWAAQAAHRVAVDRDDLERERQGVQGNRRGRFNIEDDAMKQGGGGNRRHAQQAADMMMDMIIQQNVQAAYQHNFTLNVGGEEMEFNQGDLYDKASDEVERLEEKAKEGKLSAEEQARLEYYRRMQELTDPREGPMDEDRQRELQRLIDENPEYAEELAPEGRVLDQDADADQENEIAQARFGADAQETNVYSASREAEGGSAQNWGTTTAARGLDDTPSPEIAGLQGHNLSDAFALEAFGAPAPAEPVTAQAPAAEQGADAPANTETEQTELASNTNSGGLGGGPATNGFGGAFG